MVYGPDRAAVPVVHTPLPADWSAEASARCMEKVTQKQLMQPLMSAAWASHTHFESPAISLLASRGHAPTELDWRALKHHVAYLYAMRKLGLTYYEAPEGDRNIRKTVGLRLYSDDGENQHLDGSGHWGWAAFLGDEDNGSGAVGAGSTKAKGVVGESVPINELMAAMFAVRVILILKYILEELSGATRDDIDTVETTVAGSAAPIPVAVSDAVVESVEHTDIGHLGDASRDVAAHMLALEKQKGPAVQVFGDNQGVVDNINHISHKSKGLRRVARVVSHLRSLVQHDIVKFLKVASVDQLADGMSKQINSPVQNANVLEKINGRHPDITAYVEDVHRIYNKRATGKRKAMEQVERDQYMDGDMENQAAGDGAGVFEMYAARQVRPEEKAAAIGTMQKSVGFLQWSRGMAEGFLATCGFTGTGGLGANEDGISEPLEGLTRKEYSSKKRGLGFQQGAQTNSNLFVRGTGTTGTGDSSHVDSGMGYSNGGSISDSGSASDMVLHKARIGGVLDAESERPAEIFLAERIRRALAKLTPEERLLFSCLRSEAFTDRLSRGEEVVTVTGGDVPVPSGNAANRSMQTNHHSSNAARAIGDGRSKSKKAQRNLKSRQNKKLATKGDCI
jgi:hypothetical protein